MTPRPPLAGRVIITWDMPNGHMHMALGCCVTVTDADTGQRINDAIRLTLDHGGPEGWDTGPVHVVLTRFVGADGEPSDFVSGRAPAVAPTEEYAAYLKSSADTGAPFDGQRYRTGEFRYLVTEMRVDPADRAIPKPTSSEADAVNVPVPDTLGDYLSHYEITTLPYSADLHLFYGWEQEAIDLFSNMQPSEQHVRVLSAADAASRSGAHFTQVGAFLYVMLREAAGSR